MKYVIVHTATGEHTWEFTIAKEAHLFYYQDMTAKERTEFHIEEYEDV